MFDLVNQQKSRTPPSHATTASDPVPLILDHPRHNKYHDTRILDPYEQSDLDFCYCECKNARLSCRLTGPATTLQIIRFALENILNSNRYMVVMRVGLCLLRPFGFLVGCFPVF